ncbi:MAG: hypothetical protein ACI83Y_002565, partial [Candidatus Azotimanducaceae bacterium]
MDVDTAGRSSPALGRDASTDESQFFVERRGRI